MNYTLWEDADGKYHKITEMETRYIKNCIKCIIDSDYSIYTKEAAESDKDDKIFGPKWCYEHAQNFLDAFERELNIRKRIQNRDFPSFTIQESCDTCDKCDKCDMYCEEMQTCEEWRRNRMEIFNQFKSEDLEVARRGGYICNGIKYIVSVD